MNKKILLFISAFTFSAFPAFADDGISANFDASVTILETLTMTESQSLNFGEIQRPDEGETVVVVAEGSGPGLGTTAIVTDGSRINKGIILIDGDDNTTINISIVSNDNVPGLTMTFDNSTYGNDDEEVGSSATGLTAPGLGAGGNGTELSIAARLIVDGSALESTGTLNPSYKVTVDYN